MNLTRETGSGNWIVEIKSESGKLHRINLHTTSEEEALRLLKDAHVERLEDAGKAHRLTNEVVSLIVADRAMTCEAATEEWNRWLERTAQSSRTHTNNIGVVSKWMRDCKLTDKPLSSITDDQINAYINNPQSPDKRGTRALKLAGIRGLMNFALHRRWILNDPSRLVRVNHRVLTHAQKEVKHKPVFTDDEVDFLIAQSENAEPPLVSKGFFKAAIILGRDCALRFGDICNLEWNCFDFTTNTVCVWTSKGGSRVEIPMTQRVVALLSSIEASHPVYVFPKEREIANDVDRRASLSVIFGRFLNRVGMKGYSFHSLRATYATTMANNGATLDEIATALGHKGTEVTKAYIRKPDAAKITIR